MLSGNASCPSMVSGRSKQPYAIGMKDGSPFGLAGLWRTGAIRTQEKVSSNELVVTDRMPAIL
jgi:putative SOS response-associated peptidase YedK